MSIFDEIVKTHGPVSYEFSGFGHLKMTDHYNPRSIKIDEFNYITNFIIQNELKKGFEIATAFGISALAAALGFKETNGRLISIDAYIEEHLNDAHDYWELSQSNERTLFHNMNGFKSANFLADHFDVKEYVKFVVGWSPDDVSSIIMQEFSSEKCLDYAFIDAGHFPWAIMNDIKAIAPYMKDNGFVMFHDVHDGIFNDDVYMFIKKTLGSDLKIIIPPPQGENLSYVQVKR